MSGSDVVRDMAAAREVLPPRTMTIEGAIGKALWLRMQPESILDDKQAKLTIDTLLSALEYSPCYFKAVQKGEEVFVLRMQDRAAPHAIAEWAQWARRHGCLPAKVDQALATAQRWIQQAIEKTKWPD
jgi:hypothetical protein